MQSVLGLVIFIGFAWLVSRSRRDIQWRSVVVGLMIQLTLALLLLGVPWFANGLLALNAIVEAIDAATQAGGSFVFGYLGGGPPPFEPTVEGAMNLFAFRVLPQILVFSVLVALLWYWRILPMIIRGLGWLLERSMGVGGAVGTAGSASIFLGMAETPMVVRAYLSQLSRSELFTVMTCGMSTVAGSIMVLFAGILGPVLDGALGHIITASVINVIGAVYISRLLIPPDGPPVSTAETSGLVYHGHMDAITRGTMDGLQLAVSVGAMVLVLVSLVALINYMLAGIVIGGEPLSLEGMTGWLFAPIAWLIGIPWSEAPTAGALLASKLILNEVVAYLQLGALPAGELSESSTLVMTYALCGFTNFGSLGILIGGLTTLAPERRDEVLRIAPLSLLSGSLTAAVTGSLIALVISIL